MRVLFVGGGTLGPVTPLLALHERLRGDADSRFLFVGTPRGPERAPVTEAGVPFVALSAPKLDRFLSVRLLAAPFRYVWALVRAAVILMVARPDVVVSAGAYLAVPVAQAARVLRIPSVIHQMDLPAGLANQLMARGAAAIAVSVPEAGARFPRAKTSVTGIPVREAVAGVLERRAELAAAAERRFGLDPKAPTVLVMGGGSGAKQVNDLVAATADALAASANVIHVTGTGKSGAPSTHPRYKAFPLLGRDELAEAYAAADLIVSRAGMGAIAELAVVQTPFVLVPMPDSPQEANAAYFRAHAGIPVLGKGTTPERFRDTVLGFLRLPTSWPGSIERMRALLPANAAARVADIVRRVGRREPIV